MTKKLITKMTKIMMTMMLKILMIMITKILMTMMTMMTKILMTILTKILMTSIKKTLMTNEYKDTDIKILTDGAESISNGRRVVDNDYGGIMKENGQIPTSYTDKAHKY